MKQISQPHRRYNPLKEEWILVSPQRTKRPWNGSVEKPQNIALPCYDKSCFLCPKNKRVNGDKNPDYKNSYVFQNDFQAVEPHSNSYSFSSENKLFQMHGVEGECRVLCYTPSHNKTLGNLTTEEILEIISKWQSETNTLSKKYSWIQIFENKGAVMGCSNPHPHSQIWATSTVPSEVEKESKTQKEYFEKNSNPMLVDYVKEELDDKERIILENDDWVVLTPYWALWPFETMVLPKRHIKQLNELDENTKNLLSEILKKILVKYDALFETSFPYSMGWHFAPNAKTRQDHWQLHAHFYPPLLRSASVKKFVVGYELLGEAQRDITPEMAADRLRWL